MLKKTICLLFVLALIGQICAIPADHQVDDDKDDKGAADQADGLKDEAKKAASDATNKATKDNTDVGNKDTGAGVEAKSKGEHGVAKHGGKDCHKPGTRSGPVSNGVKITEEVAKKFADRSVKAATEFMRIFGL